MSTEPEPNTPAPATAAGIAIDLALLILKGTIGENEQLPSQTKLMQAYGVAMATASAALRRVQDAGLAIGQPGRGVFVKPALWRTGDVNTLYTAGQLLQGVACTGGPPDSEATVEVGGYEHPADGWITGRIIPAGHLNQLDRNVIRALGDTFVASALRIVGNGPQPGDRRLIQAAQAVLRDGGRRPDRQAPIALYGGGNETPFEHGAAVRRVFPERFTRTPGPDDQPF
ncbi:GntR family transcriptional regulator [Nonomuraea salmonea]|uniref:GntR family transcriptional regulator n=1 Tax=Nonomuraea salmonea TaxID=46181 RepID=A0ABV5P3Z9_9ACTN